MLLSACSWIYYHVLNLFSKQNNKLFQQSGNEMNTIVIEIIAPAFMNYTFIVKRFVFTAEQQFISTVGK